MSSGRAAEGATPNINVTPLIDVLLVLLIIFMIISPLKPSRFEAKVPAEPKDEDKQVDIKPNPLTLVISIDKNNGNVKLNEDSAGNSTDTAPLTDRLTTIFRERTNEGVFRQGTNEIEKTVFVKAPKGIKYGEVVKVIDGAKLAGAQPIGLQIDDLAE
ncbi:MAG: biopolymer transporter ExbD [Pyrinomonadaceae bacterium]|nr:biopolymer transporter ExbD [Pyrinomonadaceae bacterium]